MEFAEAQRMAPLFAAHARKAGIVLPGDTGLRLQGLVLRHKLASQARARMTGEILAASQAAGIQVVLLKGAALAQTAYPDPGLRPMRDIDLLARPKSARDLQRLLIGMGFRLEQHSKGSPVSTRHLDELCKQVDGFQVTVEIHDRLFDPTWRARPPEINAWMDRARPFSTNGITAHTLNLEDMLWHIYQHMINEEIRLSAIADLVSLAERQVADIDWQRVRRCYPGVLQALALFHALSPLDERLVQAAGISRRVWTDEIGEDLQGWPRVSLSQAREVGWPQFLQQTFWPSAWWLWLYYGIKNGRAVPFYRGVVHPLEIFRLSVKHLAVRISPP